MQPVADPSVEEILLSRLFFDPKVIDSGKVGEAHFSTPRFGLLYGVCRSLRVGGHPVSADGVRALQPDLGDLAAKMAMRPLGGAPVESVIKTLDAMRVRREMAEALKRAGDAIKESDDPYGVINDTEKLIADIRSRSSRIEAVNICDVIELMGEIEADYSRPEGVRGLSSGLKSLDLYTNGFQKNRVYVLAARPGAGKTALVLNIILFLARLEKRIHCTNIEMGVTDLQRRLASTISRVDLSTSRQMTDLECASVLTALGEIGGWTHGVQLLCRGGLSVDEWEESVRAMHRQAPVDLVILDYIQRIKGSSASTRRNDSRREEIGEVMGACQQIAVSLGVPVIIISALKRRPMEWDRVKKCYNSPPPLMDDLKESGDIEQDADFIGLMVRDIVQRPNVCEITVAKNRDGPTDRIIELGFEGSNFNFYEL